jgi:hypothetical protein
MGDSINKRRWVSGSEGVSRSGGVSDSGGVKRSWGVIVSGGINTSEGVNYSGGVNNSHGVDRSDGVNNSHGVSGGCGVNLSFGILNSYGVDNAIFLADEKRSYSIFGIEVSKDRFNEVWDKLHEKLGGWFPKFNTSYIWLKKEGSWDKVDASKIKPTLNDWEKPYGAWKDMPQEAIDYVASLPEFNAVMFKRITGIDVKANVGKVDKKMRLLNKVLELLDKVDMLRKEAERL